MLYLLKFFLLNSLASAVSQHINEFEILVPGKPSHLPVNNFQSMLRKSGIVKGSEEDPIRNCSITSQYKLTIDENYEVSLHSLDINGNLKNVGGDEIYVSFHESIEKSNYSQAIALFTDRLDGSYSLKFKTPPAPDSRKMSITEFTAGSKYNKFILKIRLLYSCGIGKLPPPTKDKWPSAGQINTVFYGKIPIIPHFEVFKPPTLPISVKPFTHIICIGDSMMMHFSASSSSSTSKKITGAIDTNTAHRYLDFVDESIKSKEVQQELQKPFSSLLIIIGTGVWDVLETRSHGTIVQNEFFSNHYHAVIKIISELKRKYGSNKQIQFAWKSMTYTPINLLGQNPSPVALERTKYASYQRSQKVYALQKAIMRRMNVPFLDIFEPSFLSVEHYSDCRHMKFPINAIMWNWFFGESSAFVKES